MNNSCLIAIAISIVFASPVAFALGDEGAGARFRREYPAALSALASRYGRVRGEFEVARRVPGRPTEAYRVRFAEDGGAAKATVLDVSPGKPAARRLEKVHCVARGAFFGLYRKPGVAGYSVAGVARADSPEAASAYPERAGRFVRAPYSIGEFGIAEVLASRDFRLGSVSEVDYEGSKCIRAEMTTGLPRAGGSAVVVLDPALAWAVRRVEFVPDERQPLAKYVATIVYGVVDGFPAPRTIDVQDYGAPTIHCAFQSFEFAPTPAVEFTMGSYGLPDLTERIGRTSSGDSSGLWLMALGAAGFCAAVGLRRFARRTPNTSVGEEGVD